MEMVRRCYGKLKNSAHAIATNSLSPPDIQVKEQLLITTEPEEERPSGTTTILPDEEVEGETNGILQESTTPAGQHCIRESLFAACNKVSPRNQATTTSTSSKHLHRASLFAAAEDESSSPTVSPHKQASQENCQARPQGQQQKRANPSCLRVVCRSGSGGTHRQPRHHRCRG